MKSLKFLILMVSCVACVQTIYSDSQKIVVIAVPTMSAYALIRSITLLTTPEQAPAEPLRFVESFLGNNEQEFESKRNIILNGQVAGPFLGYLAYSPAIEQWFIDNNIKVFFMYCDPRIQFAEFACGDLPLFTITGSSERYEQVNEADVLQALTEEPIRYNNYGNDIQNIDQLYRAFMPWQHSSIACPVKLEDLTSKTDAIRMPVINTIAHHLDISPTPGQILRITIRFDNFFVMTGHDWKQYFSQTFIGAFKALAGQLLIDLGYETNLDW